MRAQMKSLLTRILDGPPAILTAIQSALVTVLATIMSAALYLSVGVHFLGVSYQIFAALLIASILAPIFLYPAFRAASRLRAAYATIQTQAFTDHLTRLPNSLSLMNELETRIVQGHSASQFAVHILDLNRFKEINDGLGFDAGDALLVAVADTLRRAVRAGGFAGLSR